MYFSETLKRVNFFQFTASIHNLIYPNLECLAIPFEFMCPIWICSSRQRDRRNFPKLNGYAHITFVQSFDCRFPTLWHGRYSQFFFIAIQFVANFHSENIFHCCSTYAFRSNHIKFDICYVITKHFVKKKL